MSHILKANHAGFKPYRNGGIYRFFLPFFLYYFLLPPHQSTTLRKESFIITAKKKKKKEKSSSYYFCRVSAEFFFFFFFSRPVIFSLHSNAAGERSALAPQFLSAAEQTAADKTRLPTLALNSRSESLASVSRRRELIWGLWGWEVGGAAVGIFHHCLTKLAQPEQRSGTWFFRMLPQFVKCKGQTFFPGSYRRRTG